MILWSLEMELVPPIEICVIVVHRKAENLKSDSLEK